MIYNFNNISPKIDKDSWYAPNSVLIGNVTLKKDANIWFNATLRGDVEPITIGEGSNIQDGSVGSTILNKAKIGKYSIIGANALVTENKVIPERSLVLGSPGKIVRQVTDEEIKHIKENAQHYVDNYKKYKKYFFCFNFFDFKLSLFRC